VTLHQGKNIVCVPSVPERKSPVKVLIYQKNDVVRAPARAPAPAPTPAPQVIASISSSYTEFWELIAEIVAEIDTILELITEKANMYPNSKGRNVGTAHDSGNLSSLLTYFSYQLTSVSFSKKDIEFFRFALSKERKKLLASTSFASQLQ